MTKRKQRHRPAAGIEIVYEDEHYSAIALDVPLYPGKSVLHIYAKPHHDLLFTAFRLGLFFQCKRCRREHLLHWYRYNRIIQAHEPPYHVLCTQVNDTWLVKADEPIPEHLKAYRLFTITGDHRGLIASIAAFINNQPPQEQRLALQEKESGI